MKRLAILISLVALSSLTFAAPVLAAAPSNDTYGGRTVIGALPFSASVDTTEATTDADDVEANTYCGAPATDASVWYELTATADGIIIVDVSASTYSAGIIVVTGSPGTFSLETCGMGVGFYGVTGQTYTILAFDDQYDGAGNGGELNITVEAAPPPPEVDVTVDPVGHFNSRTGSATLTGTVTCTGEAGKAFLDVQLSQRVGRLFTIRGSGGAGFECDGTTQPWSVEVFPESGMFKGGRAASVTNAFACGFDCGFDFEERVVMLRR